MLDYKELPDGRKVYSLDGVKSRQTGTNAETVMIIAGKNTGKTFNVRVDLISDFLENGRRFVEISRSRDEMEDVAAGYFDKILSENVFPGYIFKTDSRMGYVAKECPEDEQPDWKLCCYFASISLFQRTKRRSNYVNVCNAIFDEFIIDKRDKYHRYLPGEYGIFVNMLDSIFRPFPNDGIRRYVYMMGNSCDLSCPYLRFLGINKPPRYGFTFYREKTVLLHYVEPWDSEERRTQTIIGRLLDGTDEGDMVFENRFEVGSLDDIARKPSKARFAFALIFEDVRIGIWSDLSDCLFYVTDKIPKNARNVYALTKRDGTIDYNVISRSENLLKTLVRIFYARGLRYDSPGMRESFFRILDYLGIR